MSKESMGKKEKIVKTPFCAPCEAGHPNKDSYNNISYKGLQLQFSKNLQTWVFLVSQEVTNITSMKKQETNSSRVCAAWGQGEEWEGLEARRPGLWSPWECSSQEQSWVASALAPRRFTSAEQRRRGQGMQPKHHPQICLQPQGTCWFQTDGQLSQPLRKGGGCSLVNILLNPTWDIVSHSIPRSSH